MADCPNTDSNDYWNGYRDALTDVYNELCERGLKWQNLDAAEIIIELLVDRVGIDHEEGEVKSWKEHTNSTVTKSIG